MAEPFVGKPGEIIVFSSGEYSSYGFGPVARVVIQSDFDALWVEFQTRPGADPQGPGFSDWLDAKGVIEIVVHHEIWTGTHWEKATQSHKEVMAVD